MVQRQVVVEGVVWTGVQVAAGVQVVCVEQQVVVEPGWRVGGGYMVTPWASAPWRNWRGTRAIPWSCG